MAVIETYRSAGLFFMAFATMAMASVTMVVPPPRSTPPASSPTAFGPGNGIGDAAASEIVTLLFAVLDGKIGKAVLSAQAQRIRSAVHTSNWTVAADAAYLIAGVLAESPGGYSWWLLHDAYRAVRQRLSPSQAEALHTMLRVRLTMPTADQIFARALENATP